MTKLKRQTSEAILSLEARLDSLVYKYKNTQPEDRKQYEVRINNLCRQYKKLSGVPYIWNNSKTIDKIRNGDGGAIG